MEQTEDGRGGRKRGVPKGLQQSASKLGEGSERETDYRHSEDIMRLTERAKCGECNRIINSF